MLAALVHHKADMVPTDTISIAIDLTVTCLLMFILIALFCRASIRRTKTVGRKCRSVQRQNILDGRFVGRTAPLGFSKHPEDCRRLIVDEEAAIIVRRMFAWAADGIGGGEIVRILNEENIPTPSHYKWEKGLITNAKLLGKPFW